MSNEERIIEIDRQIEELKAEKKRLRCDSIASLVDRLILCPMRERIHDGKIIIKARRPTYETNIWGPIMTLVKEIHRPNNPAGRKQIMVRNLTNEERMISAEMAVELVDIWNKYVTQLYGDKKNEAND